MIIVAFLLGWLAIGFALGLYEARRGHWRWLWLLGAIAGPFAIPLSRQIEENEDLARPIPVAGGSGSGSGPTSVLAGIDGSHQSMDAVVGAATLLGSELGGLTLALVTDYDIHEAGDGPVDADHPTIADERRSLEDAARLVAEKIGFTPVTVILSGPPAQTLADHAVAEHFDVLAIGSKGSGMSKRMLGSCAERLASGAPVPVLVLPGS